MPKRFCRLTEWSAAAVIVLMGSGAAFAQSCLDEAGVEDAQIYVEQCLEVSPATRPPCNAENSCQMIWDEIARGCALLGRDAPQYCSEF